MAEIAPPKRSGKGLPPSAANTAGNLEKLSPGEMTAMNFKVPIEFHREFKTFAASRGMSMLEVLQEGFRLIKEKKE